MDVRRPLRPTPSRMWHVVMASPVVFLFVAARDSGITVSSEFYKFCVHTRGIFCCAPVVENRCGDGFNYKRQDFSAGRESGPFNAF